MPRLYSTEVSPASRWFVLAEVLEVVLARQPLYSHQDCTGSILPVLAPTSSIRSTAPDLLLLRHFCFVSFNIVKILVTL